MSGVVRKKQDDKYLAALRELVNTGGGNRQCFDCGQKGPTYVNMTIGSFVCTRCSGVLRGLTPPHRVKSISMATFTQDEIDFLKAHGNDDCAKTWLGLWDPKRAVHQDHRELMIDKYERKRYYLEPASPLKSLTNAASLKAAAAASNQNGSSTFTNGGHNKPLDNGFNGIQLTPPTSQRNGMQQHKSSSSAISRPQHHHQQQQDAFMVNNNNNANNTNNNNNNNMMNGFHNHHHHHQLSYSGSAGSTSTGALSDTSSCASNGFGPEADFVADFGSANIFDATSASSVGSPAVSSASSVASSNGYAKIQPIKAAQQQQQKQQQHQQQQQQFVNGHANGQLNGTSSLAAVMNGNTENFADFDHAPIYNAAAGYQFIGKSNFNRLTAIKQQDSNNNSNNNIQRQQQQQLSSSTTTTTATATTAIATTTFSNLTKPPSNNVDVAVGSFYNKRLSDGNDGVIGATYASIIGNDSGNNRNGMQEKSRNIIYSESTSNFNDPFADFGNNNNNNNNKSGSSNLNSNRGVNNNCNNNNNNNNRNSKLKIVTFESDFVDENVAQQQEQTPPQQQQQQQLPYSTLSSTKFTPLAMAAHATAMAVLGSDYHFNKYNISSSQRKMISDNNFNSYRNPFDAEEQWDVWGRESNIFDDDDNGVDDDGFSHHQSSRWNTEISENNNTLSNKSDYIALSEFRTASSPPPLPFNCEQYKHSEATSTSTTTTVPYKTMNNILTPSMFNDNIDTSQLPQSMSYSFCNESNNSNNNVVRQPPTMYSLSSPSSSSLSSYPSTNPFSTKFLQESLTNCDNNSYRITTTTSNATATTTTTTSAAINTSTTSTNATNTATSSTKFSVIRTDMPLEFFARPQLNFCDTSCHNSTSSSSSTSIPFVVNENFNSDYNTNYFCSDGGWRAMPIPNGNRKTSFSSISSSSNNNNNNNNNNTKLSSTPSEDRYAALKDLDEQLRESKAVAAAAASVVGSAVLESFGNNNNSLSLPNGVNPFKSQQQQQPNPFQMSSQHHHLQAQPNANHLYGQLTIIPTANGVGSAPATNGFGGIHQAPTAFFNYSNGFTSTAQQQQQQQHPTIVAGGPSGCGFGFGAAMQQQMTASGGVGGTVNGVGGVIGAYVNPFATSGAVNTNNPFL